MDFSVGFAMLGKKRSNNMEDSSSDDERDDTIPYNSVLSLDTRVRDLWTLDPHGDKALRLLKLTSCIRNYKITRDRFPDHDVWDACVQSLKDDLCSFTRRVVFHPSARKTVPK